MAIPQPNFVPLSPNSSRITHNNGVFEGASVLILLPLSVNVIIIPPIERLCNVPSLCGGIITTKNQVDTHSREYQLKRVGINSKYYIFKIIGIFSHFYIKTVTCVQMVDIIQYCVQSTFL
jgi:hypothetical protein